MALYEYRSINRGFSGTLYMRINRGLPVALYISINRGFTVALYKHKQGLYSGTI